MHRYKKISDLSEEHIKLIVPDQFSQKQYFSDSEVTGWIVIIKNEVKEYYHMYRRTWDTKLDKEIDEPIIFVDHKINGRDLAREKRIMMNELSIQKRTGNNHEINKLLSILG